MHPSYNCGVRFQEVMVKCKCGHEFRTKATQENLVVDICSECHPFTPNMITKRKKNGSKV